jgi:uncharacterized membrane protein YbhN (UPF0104 family)
MTITTVALWVCYVLFYHVVLMAFWPEPPLAWSVLATVAAALSMALPSSPGFIGVFHAAVALAMAPYLTTDRAAAYAIVVHATEVLCQLIFGAYSSVATGASLGRITAVADRLAHSPKEPDYASVD